MTQDEQTRHKIGLMLAVQDARNAEKRASDADPKMDFLNPLIQAMWRSEAQNEARGAWAKSLVYFLSWIR